jgi:esterase/lipase
MKKAVLLLHGFLSDQNDFSPIISQLEARYDHLERLVYPGHHPGEDYHDFNDEQTFFELDRCFERLQKQYEIIDVIGYSMGGALGVYLSSKYSFRKLVLLAPGNIYFNIFLPYAKLKDYAVNFVYLEKAAMAKDELTKHQYRIILSNTLEEDKESLRFLYEKYLHTYFRSAFRNFRNLIRRANDGVTEIKNPCFLAWGKLDQLVPIKSIRFIWEMCTNKQSKLRIYDHLSHLMLRSAFNQQLITDLIRFLDE